MRESKHEEIMRYKDMPPEKRLEKAVAHNKFIKELFFAGLAKKGFTPEEIERLYHGRVNE